MFRLIYIISFLLVFSNISAQENEDWRAIHMGGNWGANKQGTLNHPPEYFDFLNRVHAKWVGISVALHIDDSMDDTVERKYENAGITTFTDEVLSNTITSLQEHGFNVYLTLAFESYEAENAEHPVARWQLGDPNMANEDQNISAEFWPWAVDHPNHQEFVESFFSSYTDEAVHFAEIAESLGVTLFSLGTETERLFRTRSGGSWTNEFQSELLSMVNAVRQVYSGQLTYDMSYQALTENAFYGTGSNNLWQDLNLDVIGISAYFNLLNEIPVNVLSVSDFETKWEAVFQNYLIPLKNNNSGLPILFLEYGYVNSMGSPYQANHSEYNPVVFEDNNSNQLDDGEETQANIYQAFFNVNENNNRIVSGTFLWGNEMANDYEWANNWLPLRNFGIRDKLAEDVVSNYYADFDNVQSIPEQLPVDFVLYQNYPNPFNPSTVISFYNPEPVNVILKIYDILGREKLIVADENFSRGYFEIEFDASDFSSGVYFYSIFFKNKRITKKMLLIK